MSIDVKKIQKGSISVVGECEKKDVSGKLLEVVKKNFCEIKRCDTYFCEASFTSFSLTVFRPL